MMVHACNSSTGELGQGDQNFKVILGCIGFEDRLCYMRSPSQQNNNTNLMSECVFKFIYYEQYNLTLKLHYMGEGLHCINQCLQTCRGFTGLKAA